MTGGYFKPLAAAVGAIGLAVSGVCLSVPLDRCPGPVGTASAAPSPTCASDLRECLRVSARTGLYGVRYVTAEDVAHCMEAFNACNHGGASRGGNPNSPSTTPTGAGRSGFLPQRFGITTENGIQHDCRLSDAEVSCSSSWPTAPNWVDSWTGTVNGTLSGSTMTGTAQSHIRQLGGSGCIAEGDYSGPITYIFSPDKAVVMREGPTQLSANNSGSCSASDSAVIPAYESTGTWSPLG